MSLNSKEISSTLLVFKTSHTLYSHLISSEALLSSFSFLAKIIGEKLISLSLIAKALPIEPDPPKTNIFFFTHMLPFYIYIGDS